MTPLPSTINRIAILRKNGCLNGFFRQLAHDFASLMSSSSLKRFLPYNIFWRSIPPATIHADPTNHFTIVIDVFLGEKLVVYIRNLASESTFGVANELKLLEKCRRPIGPNRCSFLFQSVQQPGHSSILLRRRRLLQEVVVYRRNSSVESRYRVVPIGYQLGLSDDPKISQFFSLLHPKPNGNHISTPTNQQDTSCGIKNLISGDTGQVGSDLAISWDGQIPLLPNFSMRYQAGPALPSSETTPIVSRNTLYNSDKLQMSLF